jgi:fumarate reductase subunit C
MSEQLQSTRVASANGAEPDGLGPRTPVAQTVRTFPYRQPFSWWLKRRGYVLYMLREATALPIALWIALLLVEVYRARQGATGYEPLFAGSAPFIALSLICLAAAIWHAYTFLSLAGMIIRIPRGDGEVPARAIVGAMFSLLLLASVVIGGLLIWGGA